MRNLYLYGVLCLSLPIGAVAEGIPNIVITPTRFAQSLDSVVVPTRVITSTQIKATGAATVAGVLRFYPGFDVNRLGGAGQSTSVYVQGTASTQVKVLVNGVPVNDPNAGTVSWSQIPASDIERIEVVSGPLSTMWGGDAVGGVINIITRMPAGNGGSISVGVGNNDTRKGTLSLHGSHGHSKVGISLSGEHTAGQPVIQAAGTPAAYDNRTLSAYGSTLLGDLSIHANAWQSRGRSDFVGGGFGAAYTLPNKTYFNQTTQLGLGLPLGSRWSLKGSAEQMRHSATYYDGYGYFTRSTRNAVNSTLRYAHAGTSAAFGGSLARTRVNTNTYDRYRKVRSAYVELGQDIRGVTLTAAGRRTLDAQYGGHDTWNFGISVPLPGSARFKLSAGTGFSPPTFLDLYYPGYSNPNLKPESSHSIEAQLLAPLGRNGLFTLTAYRHRLYDVIEPNSAYIPENIGNARIRGIEASWSWTSGSWTLGADGTWQVPRNLDNGKLLTQRTQHSYRLRLRWHLRKVRLGAVWAYQGRRLAYTGGKTLEPYRLLNLTAGYRFDRRWSADMRIENALDTAYDTGYYSSGGPAYLGARRTVLLSAKYRFGSV